MSKYKPYPQYKDSGVEWLGEIPGDWSVKKLKYISNIQTGTTPSTTDESNFSDTDGIPWIKPDELDSFCSLVESKKYLTQNGLKSARLIRKNSVLVCGIGTIGKFGVAGRDLTTNQQINSVTFNKLLLPEFGKFLISSSEKEMDKFANGNVVKILNTESQKNIFYPYPSIQDQQAIANFLDNATCKIDTLILKQQNLIELLKEKRQALISHVVTKGLNPHIKMKDSGVEWLGEVPEHWEVKRVKFLFQIRKRIAGEEGYDVLSITQQGIKVKDIVSNEGQLSMDYSKYQFANIGDFAMNHMDLLTGYVDISSFNGVISPDYRVFTLEDKNSFSKFYLYIFQNGYKNRIFYKFGQGSSQLGRWRLPTDEFNDFVVPYPSFTEQQQIANYLNNATCKIDTLISKAEKAIELLKERRTTLISAAVTGKIDVRSVHE